MSRQLSDYIVFNENDQLLRNSLKNFNKFNKRVDSINVGEAKIYEDEFCMTSLCDNVTLLLKRYKNIDLFCLRDLQEKFGLDFSNDNYRNVINPNDEVSRIKYQDNKYNLDVSFNSLEMNDKNGVVSAVTCLINSAYQNYIKNQNDLQGHDIIPIVLPQHMINEIYLAENKNDLMELIDLIVGRYVDNGTVFHNPYEKQIMNAYKDIDQISSLKNGNDKECKLNYGDLIPDYRKCSYPFGFGEIGFGLDVSFKDFENISKRIKIAEEIISMIIPEKYRSSTDIEIRRNIRSMYLLGENKMLLSVDENIRGIVHEEIHSGTCHSGNDEIHIAESDYLNEFTKNGARIIYNFGYGDYACKVINTNIPKLSHYAMKMCKNYECYTTKNEFLSIAVSNILIGDISEKNGELIDLKNGNIISIDKHIRSNFAELCEQNKELSAFILTYLRGDFKM